MSRFRRFNRFKRFKRFNGFGGVVIGLATLIRNVDRVQYSQLAGGPEWLETERWDILATGAGAATWHSAFRACSIARSLTRPDCPARTGSS